jgi:hypothetical protein
LLIAQPKQVVAHDPNPLPKTNQDRIVRAEKLMSSDHSKSARNEGKCSVFTVSLSGCADRPTQPSGGESAFQGTHRARVERRKRRPKTR